jgi:hypothetical protein
MPTVGKILGQKLPVAYAWEDLYEVPTGGQTTITSITVCNTGTDGQDYSVTSAIDGGTHSPEQFIYCDVPIDGHDSFVATCGFTLSGGDVIRVSSSGSVAFQAFGLESTP